MLKYVHEDSRIVVLDDTQEIGEVLWIKVTDYIDVKRTFVSSNYRGRKIAETLVDMVIKYAKENDLKILPTCWYVEKVLNSSEEYKNLIKK